jgi:hypothetical protein
MAKMWSRNFKDGNYRYATKAILDGEFITLQQNERVINRPTQEPIRSSVLLSIADLAKMIKELGIESEVSK